MAADQADIQAIVRAAHINPFDLKWPHFLVAEEDKKIVGVGQIKIHRDGSRELASIAVVPERQGKGIGSAIILALLEEATYPIYLVCRNALESYYQRFGFRIVPPKDLPPVLGRLLRLGNLMSAVGSRLSGQRFRIIAMDCESYPSQALGAEKQHGSHHREC
jgi:N-acetylglutamate synthase-like GNAT family acetyltransferase